MTHYLIGIDLGTTNSALAYIDLRAGKTKSAPSGAGVIRHFPIPQLVAAGDVAPRELLPSFLYLPGPHDLPAGATTLPWDARRNGSSASSPAITEPGCRAGWSTSAKSWLCHAGVDRSAPLLPWSRPAGRRRAFRRSRRPHAILRHIVEAWNFAMAKDHADDRLEKQQVVLTVPASFDDMARNLTVEAAKKAGLENVTLLEEPLAAFYCWLSQRSASASRLNKEPLKPGDCCLVVDVGGGTSDFSLIQAGEQEGQLTFIRQAVGDHLLLGGDNMDLALAKFVETRLPGAGKLDAAQYGVLTQVCRQAKETLLGPNPPASHTVTVMGRGRQVIGGTLHAILTPADVRGVILDGFFPIVAADAEPQRGGRTGLHEMGLPYVSDPAISTPSGGLSCDKQLDQSGNPQIGTRPAAPLSRRFCSTAASSRRLCCAIGSSKSCMHWFNRPGHAWQPLVLTNPSLDLAVAWGRPISPGSSTPAAGASAAAWRVPTMSASRARRPSRKTRRLRPVLCVVPQHLEEGQEIALDKPELELALGQPVSFPLYTSTVRAGDRPGDLLQVSPDPASATAAACTRSCAAANAAAPRTSPSPWPHAAPRSAPWNCGASPRRATIAGGWSSTSATS